MIRTVGFDMTERPRHLHAFAFWLLIAAIASNLASPLAAMQHTDAAGMGKVVICSPDGLKSVDLGIEFGDAGSASIVAGHCGACPIHASPDLPAYTGSAGGTAFGPPSLARCGQAWAYLGEDRQPLRLFAYSFNSRAPPVLG